MASAVAKAVAKFKRLKEKDTTSGIRLDYSETYFENEHLDSHLHRKIAHLDKNKFRVGVEREENLKEIRKAAEGIQHLSNAIKKGNVSSSVPLLKSKNMDHKPPSPTVEALCSDLERVDTKRRPATSTTIGTGDESIQHKPSPINLTMFALSYHKFAVVKAGSNLASSGNQPETGQAQTYFDKSPFSLKGVSVKTVPRAFPRFDRRPKLRRPLTTRHRALKDGEVLEASDCLPIQVHTVQKSRKSKSRRELQEMSKLEQNEKYGIMEKNEERKKKLIAWAKGDEPKLEERIKTFVKDCESFTRPKTSIGIDFDVNRGGRSIVY